MVLDDEGLTPVSVKIFVVDDESISWSVSGVVGWCLEL